MRLLSDELHDVLVAFREHLEPCWRRFHVEGRRSYPLQFRDGMPSVASALTCQETSAFLYKMLTALGVSELELCGGVMRHAHELGGDGLSEHLKKDRSDISRQKVDDRGYVWEAHFWLEHNDMVIDITKDQFGWDASEIHDLATSELIYSKEPGLFPEEDLSLFVSAVLLFEGGDCARRDAESMRIRESLEAAMESARSIIGAAISSRV